MAARTFKSDKSEKSILKTLVTVTAVVGGSLLLTHCGSNSSSPSTAASFTTLYTTTFQTNNCIGCHVAGGSAWTAGSRLEFSTQANAYSTLYQATVTGTAEAGTCGTALVVTPTNAAASYILAILPPATQTTNFAGITGCDPNPLTAHSSVNLSATDVANITGWINAGALNN